jgi:oligosaccharide reducing-end xylanase
MRLAFTFSALFASTAFAGSIAPSYEIGKWQGFRAAAVSYTFDDNLPKQYSVAVPMFDAKGFKLTLFTVSDWVKSWDPLQKAAANGHEVASHAATHANFGSLTDDARARECIDSKTAINAHIADHPCVTIAYPYCVGGNDAITSQSYIAARGCSGEIIPPTPANFMNVSSIACGSEGSVKTPNDFNEQVEKAAAAGGWCVFLIHALDDDKGYSPLPSATLQSSLDYVHAQPDRFWVQSFGNVIRYIKERDRASVTETSSTDTMLMINVTDDLENSIYNFPLTIRRRLPTGWDSAVVRQAGRPIATQIITIHDAKYVMFDVVPDTGEVTITRRDSR